MTAARALADALDRTTVPCQGPDGELWTSESLTYRRLAVVRCRCCPIRAVCAAAAVERDERWHVWGGVDYSTLSQRKKNRTG